MACRATKTGYELVVVLRNAEVRTEAIDELVPICLAGMATGVFAGLVGFLAVDGEGVAALLLIGERTVDWHAKSPEIGRFLWK
jgi:hypothetical protein